MMELCEVVWGLERNPPSHSIFRFHHEGPMEPSSSNGFLKEEKVSRRESDVEVLSGGRPLKLSMNGLSMGFADRENSRRTPGDRPSYR